LLVRIDKIVRSRRKTIALIINRDGQLVVRAPVHASDKQIRALVQEKEPWIRSRQSQAARMRVESQPRRFVEGEEFQFLGSLHPLKIRSKKRPRLELDGVFWLSESCLDNPRQVFENWYRDQARAVFTDRAGEFARQHRLEFNKIRISSARTRWGSCSSKGNLNFTWRLVMAPMEIIDYVVVHELAHLRIKNHSRQFWGLVGSMIPDYKLRREWLKKNGHRLVL
jgi:predicted metal-dependent hydrolase